MATIHKIRLLCLLVFCLLLALNGCSHHENNEVNIYLRKSDQKNDTIFQAPLSCNYILPDEDTCFTIYIKEQSSGADIKKTELCRLFSDTTEAEIQASFSLNKDSIFWKAGEKHTEIYSDLIADSALFWTYLSSAESDVIKNQSPIKLNDEIVLAVIGFKESSVKIEPLSCLEIMEDPSVLKNYNYIQLLIAKFEEK